MRNILIASYAFSELCRSMTRVVRHEIKGVQVDHRYGSLFETLRERDQFDLSGYGFLLLRLNHMRRNKDSDTYNLERKLIIAAIRRRIPIGIVCDEKGDYLAPYLMDEVAREMNFVEQVKLVVVNGPSRICSPSDVYPCAVPFDISRSEQTLMQIAECIRDNLPHMPRTDAQTYVSQQMTASNTPQSNYTD